MVAFDYMRQIYLLYFRRLYKQCWFKCGVVRLSNRRFWNTRALNKQYPTPNRVYQNDIDLYAVMSVALPLMHLKFSRFPVKD